MHFQAYLIEANQIYLFLIGGRVRYIVKNTMTPRVINMCIVYIMQWYIYIETNIYHN